MMDLYTIALRVMDKGLFEFPTSKWVVQVDCKCVETPIRIWLYDRIMVGLGYVLVSDPADLGFKFFQKLPCVVLRVSIQTVWGTLYGRGPITVTSFRDTPKGKQETNSTRFNPQKMICILFILDKCSTLYPPLVLLDT